MSIESELKEYILSKYKSIRAFSTVADIPYSTVDTMLKRGIGGTGVNTVIKICQTLNIDTESLGNGKIKEIKKDAILSIEEFNLLNQYRVIDFYGKKLLREVAKHEYDRCTSADIKNDGLILTPTAARSEENRIKIHTEYAKDLSKYKPDDSDL